MPETLYLVTATEADERDPWTIHLCHTAAEALTSFHVATDSRYSANPDPIATHLADIEEAGGDCSRVYVIPIQTDGRWGSATGYVAPIYLTSVGQLTCAHHYSPVTDIVADPTCVTCGYRPTGTARYAAFASLTTEAHA